MIKKMSPGQKIILFSCIILFIFFAAISTFALKKSYDYSRKQAYDAALFTTKYNSTIFENYFDKIKTIGESLANQCETLVENNNPSRELVISTLENTLSTYDDYIFGVTVAYEPNKFDNNDSNSSNFKGSGPNGEFVPYVTKVKNNDFWVESAFSPNASDAQGKWYLETKKTKKVYLTEPTVYTVNNKSVAMVSVTFPIIRDNEFVGVVSIDASLDYLQSKISQDKPLGGFSEVISSGGLYIASGQNSDKILKPVDSYDNFDVLFDKVSKNENFSDIYIDEKTSEKHLAVANPVHLDESEQVWAYVSIIPFSNIFKDFNVYFKTILYACLLILAFIVYINYWIISRDL